MPKPGRRIACSRRSKPLLLPRTLALTEAISRCSSRILHRRGRACPAGFWPLRDQGSSTSSAAPDSGASASAGASKSSWRRRGVAPRWRATPLLRLSARRSNSIRSSDDLEPFPKKLRDFFEWEFAPEFCFGAISYRSESALIAPGEASRSACSLSRECARLHSKKCERRAKSPAKSAWRPNRTKTSVLMVADRAMPTLFKRQNQRSGATPRCAQSPLDIVDEVVRVFEADRKPKQALGNP